MVKLRDGMPFPVVKNRVHETIIRESEYICDISSSTSPINVQQFKINGSSNGTFVNLSMFLLPYETYRFDYIDFYYKPQVTNLVATNITNSQNIGYIAMAFVNNPYDTNIIQNKTQLLQLEGVVHAIPSSPLLLRVDSRHIRNLNYLYTNTLVSSNDIPQDLRMTDTGILYICTGNSSVSVPIGELYVKYQVSARKLNPQYSISGTSNSWGVYYLTGVDYTTNMLGTAQTAQAGTDLPITFLNVPELPLYTSAPASLLIFPDSAIGTYNIQFNIVQSLGVCSFAFTGINNLLPGTMTYNTVYYQSNGFSPPTSSGANVTNFTFNMMVSIPNKGQYNELGYNYANYIWFSSGIGYVTPISGYQIIIQQIPPDSV